MQLTKFEKDLIQVLRKHNLSYSVILGLVDHYKKHPAKIDFYGENYLRKLENIVEDIEGLLDVVESPRCKYCNKELSKFDLDEFYEIMEIDYFCDSKCENEYWNDEHDKQFKTE